MKSLIKDTKVIQRHSDGQSGGHVLVLRWPPTEPPIGAPKEVNILVVSCIRDLIRVEATLCSSVCDYLQILCVSKALINRTTRQVITCYLYS